MRTPLPLEMTFACTATGQFNDWLSSSGNKVTDVRLLDDGRYIYYETDLVVEEPIVSIIKFDINLGGLTISSPAFEAQQLQQEVDFLSSNAPNSIGWTLEQLQDFEPESADSTFLQVQSFKTKVPDLLPNVQILEAGIRATIQFEVMGNKVRHKIWQMRKLLKYNVA